MGTPPWDPRRNIFQISKPLRNPTFIFNGQNKSQPELAAGFCLAVGNESWVPQRPRKLEYLPPGVPGGGSNADPRGLTQTPGGYGSGKTNTGDLYHCNSPREARALEPLTAQAMTKTRRRDGRRKKYPKRWQRKCGTPLPPIQCSRLVQRVGERRKLSEASAQQLEHARTLHRGDGGRGGGPLIFTHASDIYSVYCPWAGVVPR